MSSSSSAPSRLHPPRLRAAIGLLLVCWLPACGLVSAGGPLELQAPFILSNLLHHWSSIDGRSEGVEIRMLVRDSQGAAVPYALVQFDWEEGGRTAFQSDAEGTFWIRFKDTSLVSDATVTLRVIPIEQEFVVEAYDDFSSTLSGGTVLVSFTGYTPRAPKT